MVRLKTLDIWIPTFPFCSYHDDGFVDSIVEHTEKLSQKYGMNFVDYSRDPNASGKIVGGKGIFRTHYHIFYLNKHNEVTNLRIRAHEETHFLEMMRFVDKLERRLLEEQGVRMELGAILLDGEDVQGKEIIAHIGSIYALVKKGFNPTDIKTEIKEFKHARKLYYNQIKP